MSNISLFIAHITAVMGILTVLKGKTPHFDPLSEHNNDRCITILDLSNAKIKTILC